MENKNVVETRNIISKIAGHIERSGIISSQLRTVDDGQQLYDQVQQSELALRTARETAESTLAEYTKQKQELELNERKLASLVRIGAEVCSIFGVEIANDVLKADVSDPQAAAVHIGHYLARVPNFGSAIAQGIAEQRSRFLESELAIKSVQAHAEVGSRELTSAYYRAVSIVAQAKAYLAVKGVTVRDRKPSPRARKKPLAVVPASSPPAANPSSPSAPAPIPTLIAIPEAA